MPATDGRAKAWLPTALGVAAGYVLIGVSTAALARGAAAPGPRTAARLTAWIASALLFALHIRVVRRAGLPPLRSAGRTSTAVAAATLVLAGVAVAHQARAGHLTPPVLFTFVVWPALTGVVSLAVGALIFRLSRHPKAS